jgi:hypothetical protein
MLRISPKQSHLDSIEAYVCICPTQQCPCECGECGDIFEYYDIHDSEDNQRYIQVSINNHKYG